MVPELDRLTAGEVELVYKAPLLVCLLIAGADGKIDRKEIREAMNFVEKKHKRTISAVSELLQEVLKDFEEKLKILIQAYPYETTQRGPLISEELGGLNPLWRKLDPTFSHEFYKTLLSIAENIATSSGGLLGFKTVGSEEARYIKLGMIKNPSGN